MRISIPRLIVATLTAVAMMAGPASLPALANETKLVDLSISQSGPNSVTEKTFATYAITVSNLGPQPANGVLVSAEVSAGEYISATGHRWNCELIVNKARCVYSGASLDQGSTTGPLQLVVQAPSKSSTDAITHTATVSTVSSDYSDTNLDNNSTTMTTQVTKGVDLQVDQADEPDPVTAGNTVRYIISVINNHATASATNVAVNTSASGGSVTSISGDGWSCTASPLDPKKASCSRGLAIAPKTTAPPVYLLVKTPFSTSTSSISNTAVVSANSADTVTSNNTDVQRTTVTPASDGTSTDKTVTGYVGPSGGEISTCSGAGTTSNDPTCTTVVFPSGGPGGVASLVEGPELDICDSVGCAGGSVDVIVPNGYDYPTTTAIKVYLYVDKDVALVQHDTGREIYFEKPANPADPKSKTEALALPACTAVPVRGIPCVRKQERIPDDPLTDKPYEGDFLGIVELFSQDPLFEVGDGPAI